MNGGENKQSVALACITSGSVDLAFLDSVVRLYEDERIRPRITAFLGYQSGPHLSLGRTRIVEWFLETKAAWLLMLDVDMSFTPDAALAVLDTANAERSPIVGGLFYGFQPATGMVIEAMRENSDGYPMPIDAPSDGSLVDVDFIGAGFLCVHRRVFQKLAELHPSPLPYFEEIIHNGLPLGEDWGFCVRARAAGFPIYLHSGAPVAHVKRIPIGATLIKASVR